VFDWLYSISSQGNNVSSFLFSYSTKGKFNWNFKSQGLIVSSPAIGLLNGKTRIYFGSYDGNLYALRQDGSYLWKFSSGGSIHSSPAVGPDGTVWVGSNDHNLYALDPGSGSIQSQITTGGPVKSSPAILQNGSVVVGSDDATVYG
jgi:outer membrane protein assembly factor BamB